MGRGTKGFLLALIVLLFGAPASYAVAPSAPTITNLPAQARLGDRIYVDIRSGISPSGLRTNIFCTGTGSDKVNGASSGYYTGGTLISLSFAFSVSGNQTVTCSSYDEQGAVSSSASGIILITRGLVSLAITGPSLLLGNTSNAGCYQGRVTYDDGTAETVVFNPTLANNSALTLLSNGTQACNGYWANTGNVTADTAVTISGSYTNGISTVYASLPVTVRPATPTITRLSISGRSQLDSGSQGNYYTATASYSNGNDAIVAATWSITGTGTSVAPGYINGLTTSPAGVVSIGYAAPSATVNLVATYTSGGVTYTASYPITVTHVSVPLSGLAISGATSLGERESSTYTATATYADGSTRIVTPIWSCGGGASITAAGVLTTTTVSQQASTQIVATYTEGSYTASANFALTIRQTLPRPVSITISGPTTVNEGGTASYTATATYSDGTTRAVIPTTWQITGGNAAGLATIATTTQGGTLTAGQVNGDLSIRLTATFSDGTTSNNITADYGVTIKDVPAVTLTPSFLATPTTGLAPLTVSVSATAATSASDPVSRYAWSASNGATASGQTASFAFSTAGSYQIVLTVTTQSGRTASTSQTIAVTGTSVASVTPLTASLGRPTTFSISGANFVSGMGIYIPGCVPVAGQTLNVLNVTSSTSATYQCVPGPVSGGNGAGTQASSIKIAPGATTALYTFNVVVSSAIPSVSSVAPTTATLGQATTFVVNGANLASGMGIYIPGCVPTAGQTLNVLNVTSSTSATYQCVPGAVPGGDGIGAQASSIKTAPDGTVLYNFSVSVSAPTPLISNVAPTIATLGRAATFSVVGTNLVAGMGIYIPGCVPTAGQTLNALNVTSSTSATYQCVPGPVPGGNGVGTQASSIKIAPGAATALYSFNVVVSAATPSVTGVVPTNATLGQATTFVVTGSNLASGMGIYIPGCVPVAGQTLNVLVVTSTTSATYQCTPGTVPGGDGTGTQASQIKTSLGGSVVYDFNVTVAAAVFSGSVSSISPAAARLGVLQRFTLNGNGLTGTAIASVDNCSPYGSQSSTGASLTFSCIPTLPGEKVVRINGRSVGLVIGVDHPARVGRSDLRGISSVDAVSLWNGNVHLEAIDLAVPGKGVSFVLKRSYNSYDSTLEASRGSVSNAAPWRFNWWGMKLGYVTDSGNQQIWIQREDGSGESFFKDTDANWYPMDQGNFDLLKIDTPITGQVTLFTREGLKYVFENPESGGMLTGIYDHDGNGLTARLDTNNRVSSVSDASGRAYNFSYDSNGLLTRVTDFAGRSVQYTWEASSSPTNVRLKSVIDVRGGTTTYTYTTQTSSAQMDHATQVLLTSVVDPRGNTSRRFAYTDTVYGNWGASSLTDAQGNTWNFSYCAKQSDGRCSTDPNAAVSFQTTATSPLGAVTVARFDTSGREVELVDTSGKSSLTTPMSVAGIAAKNYNLAALATYKQSALGVSGGYGTSYTYAADNSGNLATQTDAENGVTRRDWLDDPTISVAKNLQRVTRLTTATGATHNFTYAANGNMQSYAPPGLQAITLAYDSAGQATSVTDGRSNTTRREYDTYGNLTKITGPDSRSVQYTYDSLGRILTMIDKRNDVTSYSWDAAGNLLSIVDALNGRLVHTYDANGNRISTTDARGNVANYSYDASNQLKTISKAVGSQTLTTTYNYDVLGRVVSTVNANGHADVATYDAEGNALTRANALAFSTQYQYDSDNRVTRVTGPEGSITDISYDKVGRVTTVTSAAGSTTYSYDGDGRMTTSTDPRGKVTQYTYDGAGRLITLVDANGRSTRATYDANGNVLTLVDPNGNSTTFTYDTLNRPLTRVDANGNQWNSSYDENGNIRTSTVPGNRTTAYTYDALNRVTRVDYPDASSVTFTYDGNGNRTSMTDATGTTNYTYDALDRMVSKTDPLGKTISYAYDGIGNVTSVGYPGGQAVSYRYDAGERLISLSDWLGKTTTYALNRAGQVTSVLLGNSSRTDMTYDAAGRLNSLVNKKPDGSVISSHGMTLDGNGNLISANVQVPLQPNIANLSRVFTYDGANRLATYNGTPVIHDTAGRITGLSGSTFTFDSRDLITAISGDQNSSYAYNGDGHRVLRNINGQVTRFVVDPNRGLPEVIEEADSSGTAQRRYVYGYGLVEQIDRANAVSYYHFDPTGSTLALTNDSGELTDSYAYAPYGETTAFGANPNPFRYVGKLGVMDDGNGMQYMRARYYRPDLARFTSLDAIAGSPDSPQSLNRYMYALGNPVTKVDPSGLLSWRDAWYATAATLDLTGGIAQLVAAGGLLQTGHYANAASLAMAGISSIDESSEYVNALTADSLFAINNAFSDEKIKDITPGAIPGIFHKITSNKLARANSAVRTIMSLKDIPSTLNRSAKLMRMGGQAKTMQALFGGGKNIFGGAYGAMNDAIAALRTGYDYYEWLRQCCRSGSVNLLTGDGSTVLFGKQ